jgi:hypothetical protein
MSVHISYFHPKPFYSTFAVMFNAPTFFLFCNSYFYMLAGLVSVSIGFALMFAIYSLNDRLIADLKIINSFAAESQVKNTNALLNLPVFNDLQELVRGLTTRISELEQKQKIQDPEDEQKEPG